MHFWFCCFIVVKNFAVYSLKLEKLINFNFSFFGIYIREISIFGVIVISLVRRDWGGADW